MVAIHHIRVVTLLAWFCVSAFSWAGITPHADQASYDFFYYKEPLLDVVNDVRRLSKKNILFRPSDLKGVSVSYGSEQVELMAAFSEVLDIYGFGFKRMADSIFMIERIRSVEEVEASLLRSASSETGAVAMVSLDVLPETDNVLDSQTSALVVSPPVPDSEAKEAISSPEGGEERVEEDSDFENPELIQAVASFQRRYTEALVAEGFSQEEAMKMAMSFNPAALVPLEETPPTP